MDIVSVSTYAMDVMMNVDRLPGEDGFAVVTNNTYLPGGSGTNVMVQAARLGATTGFMGLLGSDTLGEDIIKSLKAEGIDTSHVIRKEGGISLHTDIVVDTEGKKFILLNMGDSFLSYDPKDVSKDYISKAKVYYTDLLPYTAALEGLKVAKEAGLKTGFNMQVDLFTMNGFGASKEAVLDSLKYVDLFAPCRAGLYQICGTEDLEECLKYIRQYFNGTLLVTLGSKGSVAFDDKDKKYECPARNIKAVDTTGAGDSFMGAMLYAYLLRGMELGKAMEIATACSAITCQGLGARSTPTKEKVEEVLSQVF